MSKESYKSEEVEELIDFVMCKARSADILMTFICIEGMDKRFMKALEGMKDDKEKMFIIDELKSFRKLFDGAN